MAPSKKDVERYYFDRFAERLGSLPEGEIVSTEEPDFLIAGHAETVGVELTELHRSARPGTIPQQATEAMRQRVVARAQEVYELTSGPAIRCVVHFQDRHIEKVDVANLAQAIASLATKNLPLPNSSTHEEYEWTNRDYFPEAINTISIHRLNGITQTHFVCPGATWVASLNAADVQRILDAKEAKYPTYRARCAEVWLVINADTVSMSTWFQFDAAPLSDTFISSFDRVFIFRHFGGNLHELNVTPPHIQHLSG